MKNKSNEINLMVFRSDMTIKSIPEKKLSKLSNIEFLLIPITGFKSVGYLYVEPTRFLKFKRASIDFQFTLNYWSDGMQEYIIELEPATIETDSKITLYNLLYSFMRYQRVTSFENVFVDEDIPADIVVEPKYFDLTLYDDDDEEMYSVHIGSALDSVSKYSMIDNMICNLFGTLDKDIFNARGKDKFITIRNNEWDICATRNLKKSDLVGIGSVYTKSIVFIEATDLICMKESIKDISVQFNVLDFNQYPVSSTTEPFEVLDSIGYEIVPIKSTEYWIHDMNDIILFMDSLRSYSALLTTFIHAIYKKYFADQYKHMSIGPLVIVSTNFLSIKYRSNTQLFLQENLPDLDYYIKEIVSCRSSL